VFLQEIYISPPYQLLNTDVDWIYILLLFSNYDFQKLKNLIATREYHVVVMSDYGQGVFSETTAQFIISNSRRHGIPTIVDPGKRGRYDRFDGATYIKFCWYVGLFPLNFGGMVPTYQQSLM
jgi:bifunctional ADP-heptose synthase (sugar kinase/adenylyltransferase)